MSEPLSYKDLEHLVKELNIEKRQLEEDLQLKENTYKSKENLYNQIINHTHEAVIVIQGDALKFINKAALSLLDTHKEDLEKVKFSEIIHPDQRGEIIRYVSRIVSGENASLETESEIISISGKVIPARIKFKKLTLANNQVSVLVQIENIQEFKSKENEVKNIRKAVEFLDKYA
jgi:PAS domain S-box-containing protein